VAEESSVRRSFSLPRAQALESRILLAVNPTLQVADVNVSASPTWQSEGPALNVNQGKVQVVWGERNVSQIRFREFTPSTNAWSTTDVFADGANAQYQWPDLATGTGGRTHLVYPSSNASSSDPVYSRVRPSGGSWSGVVTVANDDFPNPARMAAAPNGTLWAVWRDANGTAVQYRRSTDGGVTWHIPAEATAPANSGNVATQGGNMFSPDIFITPDGVPHVTWNRRDGGLNNNTIYCADWNGTGWTVPTIGNQGAYTCDAATAVGPDGTAHMVCRTQSGSGWTLKYLYRLPGGAWTNGPDIYTTGGDVAYVPAITVDAAGVVHVTYNERSGSVSRVYYQMLAPGASSWTSRTTMSTQSLWDSRTAVVTTPVGDGTGANLTHVVYQRGGTAGDTDEITYVRFRTDFIKPTASIAASSPNPRTTPVASLFITFSEAVQGFTTTNLTLTRSGTGVSLAGASPSSADGKTFTLSGLSGVTAAPGLYVLSVAGSNISDAYFNGMSSTASTTWLVEADTPAWLVAGSVATWNASTHALHVTGAASITADPGTDAPAVTVDGSSAVLTINTTSGTVVALASLTLTNGGRAAMSAHGAGTIRALVVNSTPTIGPSSSLDLADNAMVVKDGSLAAIASAVATGFHGGDWQGVGGITSSAAASNAAGVTALGYGSNATLGKTAFAGVTGLAASDVLINYTYCGDADLSGAVTLDDFTLFLNGYQNASNTWLSGDFDYSGAVSLDDFTQFLAGYQKQGPTL
jgi:hypothetical protein